MSDFLKSAMGYFNPGPNGQPDNDFVGQIVEVASVKLRVKRVIAEGLYMKNSDNDNEYLLDFNVIHPIVHPHT